MSLRLTHCSCAGWDTPDLTAPETKEDSRAFREKHYLKKKVLPVLNETNKNK